MKPSASDAVAAPVSETARLGALRRLNLPSTANGESFDTVARVAARALRAPFAFLTLVDEQWERVVGSSGLADSSAAAPSVFAHAEAPGHHVVVARAPLAVSDADAAPGDLGQAILGFGGRAYLGVPLWGGDQAIGTLCVLDRERRNWTPDEIALVQDLAATAGELMQAQARAAEDTDDIVNAEIVANSSEGIAIIDPQGQYVQQNDVHRQLLGYSDEELYGKTPAIHFGDEVFQDVAGELSRSGRYRGELVSRCKDGRLIDVELSAFAVCDRDGTPRYFVGVKRNITARKRAQRRQEELNAAERRAREDAENAVRARDEFLSIASHELRNPVAGIRGAVQLLRRARDRGRLTEERTARYLEMIDTTSVRLVQLTDDLLDVSRLQRGKMPLRLRDSDLHELTRQVVARHRLGAPTRRFELRVDEGDYACMLDPDRFDQIVGNLLDNAVKYSREGGEIRVTLAPEGEGLLLRVEDDGMGLPNGEEEQIFEPFGRASNAKAESIPGIGIGLYICRRIAEQHGGRLRAESAGEGRGTTMSLWLPREPVDAGEPLGA